ncbi:BREX-1 system phosphatase PglZ type A [Vibrio fluminensis]|uniref:BREX-1 system phosphatase PglZ type A n=1 Tax=Vibrio fluminensis TaxID=2783614 RepID=UPI0018884773|nr:BREX-1 system phosphatase PglZ type A [Vibrio fluminensis]
MNIDQISQGILAKFDTCRLVLWQDEDQEFTEQLDQLAINGIEVINLDDFSHFQVKERIELREPTTQFLLYSTQTPSEPARDWLYDIRLYAPAFYADSSSMILHDLGMRMEFRPLAAQYRTFFTNKERIVRLKKLLPTNANKEEFELALMAATLKVESPNFQAIVQQLLVELAEDAHCDEHVEAQTTSLAELAKYNLLSTFWQFAYQEFGFGVACDGDADAKPVPQLHDLAVKLLFTECYQSLLNGGLPTKESVLDCFTPHLLPLPINEHGERDEDAQRVGFNSSKRAAAVFLIKNWRENSKNQAAYNRLSAEVERTFELKSILSQVNMPCYLSASETFEYAEQKMILLLANQINDLDQAKVDDLVAQRLTSHWSRSEPKYGYMLKAIKAAKQFYSLKQQYIGGFHFDSAQAMYRAYEQTLFRFDATYRQFCENATHVAQDGADILKGTGLVDDIENLYVNWYLHDLAIAWGKLVDQDKLLDNWKLAGVSNQYDFYQRQVESVFHTASQVKKVFVIISDALRYEVAHDIHDQLNNEKRFKSEIKSQLGVVPSYTQLGMAALLPHNKLTAHLGNKVEYKADGISVHGLENRQKILASRNGVAFKASEVMSWTNEQGRQNVYDARVVYIYHDQIDAIGDKAATEDQTFAACADAVNQIKKLVDRIINRLNGSRIVVTADHGFLFKTSDVVESDKTALAVMPQGAIEAKKRYLIGEHLPADDYYWLGKMVTTANLCKEGSDPEFMVPRGSNRFNFVGGAKFIHGGIMPQEICVPVLHIRGLKSEKQQAQYAKEKVNVVPISPIRLVSLSDKIEFLQTDAVGDQFMARKLKVWIEDPNGVAVSGKQDVLFDSTSTSIDDRKRKVVFVLQGNGFDRNTDYKLVMDDITQEGKISRLPAHSVTIDIAIEDDFF